MQKCEVTTYCLTDENIAKIACEVATLCEMENNNADVKRLYKALKDYERKRDNLIKAVSECDIESVRKSLYDEISKVNTSHTDTEKQIVIEESQQVKLTAPEIIFFLTQLKKGNVNDIKYRKALISVFVNAIYLYDDKITFIFNSQDRPVEINASLLVDIESSSMAQSTTLMKAIRQICKSKGSPKNGFPFDFIIFVRCRLDKIKVSIWM